MLSTRGTDMEKSSSCRGPAKYFVMSDPCRRVGTCFARDLGSKTICYEQKRISVCTKTTLRTAAEVKLSTRCNHHYVPLLVLDKRIMCVRKKDGVRKCKVFKN